MKNVTLLLFVALSLMLAPVAQALEANRIKDSCHDVSFLNHHHHESNLQADEHAQLDLDSEGNPLNKVTHNHSHHHGSDFNPAYSGIDLATPIEGSTSLVYWKDNFYSDHCVSPRLEPPSHA